MTPSHAIGGASIGQAPLGGVLWPLGDADEDTDRSVPITVLSGAAFTLTSIAATDSSASSTITNLGESVNVTVTPAD
jgi:hypothetical protein